MTHPKIDAKNQKGSVVLMAIFLVFFVTTLMITLELVRLSDLEIITGHIKEMEAYYCAEAGIEFYIYSYRRNTALLAREPALPPAAINPPAALCITTVPATTRTYQASITTTKADPNVSFYHYVHITSTGTTGGFKRRVKVDYKRPWVADVRPPPPGPPTTYLDFIQIFEWREL